MADNLTDIEFQIMVCQQYIHELDTGVRKMLKIGDTSELDRIQRIIDFSTLRLQVLKLEKRIIQLESK